MANNKNMGTFQYFQWEFIGIYDIYAADLRWWRRWRILSHATLPTVGYIIYTVTVHNSHMKQLGFNSFFLNERITGRPHPDETWPKRMKQADFAEATWGFDLNRTILAFASALLKNVGFNERFLSVFVTASRFPTFSGKALACLYLRFVWVQTYQFDHANCLFNDRAGWLKPVATHGGIRQNKNEPWELA